MWYRMLMGIAARHNIKPWDNDKEVLLKVAVTEKVHDEARVSAQGRHSHFLRQLYGEIKKTIKKTDTTYLLYLNHWHDFLLYLLASVASWKGLLTTCRPYLY